MQARALRQLRRAERTRARERAIQPQPVAEVDHQRNHLALLVAPHVERERAELLGIQGSGISAHRDSPLPAGYY